MGVSITLTFRWPMGHRILGLVGAGAKCKNVHGHNWTADVELPNDDGALEFGAVKQVIGGWIDERWDHGFMLAESDPFLDWLLDNNMKHYCVPCRPDTECVARTLGENVTRIIGTAPLRVHVLEGYRNAATWTPAAWVDLTMPTVTPEQAREFIGVRPKAGKR
jgi:6-pyruvoyltetrahydropterin/6-carboxytetrahydropterin synthase